MEALVTGSSSRREKSEKHLYPTLEQSVDSRSPILPCGVTVAQMILDHFVMVRIHARQPLLPSVRAEPRGT